MCIRDSQEGADQAAENEELGTQEQPEAELAAQVAERRSRAVSYTHLTLPTSDLV